MYCPVVVCDSHSVCRGIGSVRYEDGCSNEDDPLVSDC